MTGQRLVVSRRDRLRRLVLPAATGVAALLAVTVGVRGQGLRPAAPQTEFVQGREVAAGEVLVRFRPAMRTTEVERDVDTDTSEPIGATSWRRLRSRSRTSQQLLTQLKARFEVQAAEPNHIIRSAAIPADPSFTQLWALKNFTTPGADIHALSAWNLSTGTRASVVGVVDTGIDYSHPDLQANIWSAPSAFNVTIAGRVIHCPAGSHGFNAIVLTCDPLDDHGHGTHVAGTIAATGNNGIGVVGVNWTASVMALKFLNSGGVGTLADAVNAMEFAIQAKVQFAGTAGANVRILSNSWGASESSLSLAQEIERAATNDMLVVAAAGNSGSNNDVNPYYPASYASANVVAVAATSTDDTLAGFSSYGQASVDLAAPGVNILSTTAGGGYATLSGTSMATAQVSGAAALVLSKCAIATATLRSALVNTVDARSWLQGLLVSGGRLNVDAAIRSCATSSNAAPSVAFTQPVDDATVPYPASVTLAVDATDTDGTIARVDFYANTTWIGADTSSPFTLTWINPGVGSYILTAVATDNGGASTASNGLHISIQSAGLPAPWSGQDVGTPSPAGSASINGSVFTVTGGGADIWGSADAFHFVSQPLTGDGQIVARVTGVPATNGWAKAGVMVREDLTAGARYAALLVSPSNGLAFQRRTITNGGSTYTPSPGSAPTWVRLIRAGATITAARSGDGASWTTIGSDTLAPGTTVRIGVVVTSHNDGVAGTTTLDNVTVSASSPPPPNQPPTVALTSPTDATPPFTAPATIALAATASDADGTVSRVDFYAGAALVGTSTSAPYAASWSSVAAGIYSMTAVAVDNSGASTTSAPVVVTVQSAPAPPPPPSSGLPSPWQGQDVGSSLPAGSATFGSGLFTVTGGGADIWGSADAFYFVSQPLSGDGQIVARVTGVPATNGWAKAGVMVREDFTPGARYAALLVSSMNGLAFQRRTVANGGSAYTPAPGPVPQWVRLTRTGATLTAERSSDGGSWTTIGSDTLAVGTTVWIGLAVTSHTNGVAGTATFDNVTVNGSSPPVNQPPTVALTSPTGSTPPFTAPATIPLAATASDPDGTIARVDFYSGATLIATVTSAPYVATWSNVAAGTYSVTAVATDNIGASTPSAPSLVTVQSPAPPPPPPSGLPGPWQAQDVGSPAPNGGATGSGGVFTVTGGGADIWGSLDAFQFAYQSLTGDGQIVARVTAVPSTNGWAKAGVMVREDLTPGARNAALMVSFGNGLAFQRRTTANGASAYTPAPGSASVWVRLTRTGTTFTAARSSDGVNWTVVGSDTLSVGATVWVGLAVTSHNDGVPGTATFDNVTVGP